MIDNVSTLTNQRAIKSAFRTMMKEKGYDFYSESEFDKLTDYPTKYVVENSSYRGVYESKSRSPFKVVDTDKNITERIEITYQKSQGSVDSKFPYFYLNAALGHNDNVIMLVDGGGYKKKAREWLKNNIEKRWLLEKDKEIKLVNLGEFLSYIEEIYWDGFKKP